MEYLVKISDIEDMELFKICLDYWQKLASDLYTLEVHFSPAMIQQASGGGLQGSTGFQTSAALNPGGVGVYSATSARKLLYADLLTRVREVMIFHMAKPEDVLIEENERGEIVKEFTKDTEALAVYKKEGIEIVDIRLPNTKHAISVYYIIQPAEVSSNLGRYDGIRFGNGRESFGAEAIRRIMLGTYVLSAGYYDAYYLKAQKVRSKIIEDFDIAFQKVDAIFAPVTPEPAFKIGEKSEDPLKMYLADIDTASANLAGIPGLAVPSGFTKGGLPLGFQLLGPRFAEPTLFALGKMYQEATNYVPKLAI
jgi:Asp-tRNA(Asn)/Glu-tRNA(Gln) amidotransferase A subunit family amidase